MRISYLLRKIYFLLYIFLRMPVKLASAVGGYDEPINYLRV